MYTYVPIVVYKLHKFPMNKNKWNFGKGIKICKITSLQTLINTQWRIIEIASNIEQVSGEVGTESSLYLSKLKAVTLTVHDKFRIHADADSAADVKMDRRCIEMLRILKRQIKT